MIRSGNVTWTLRGPCQRRCWSSFGLNFLCELKNWILSPPNVRLVELLCATCSEVDKKCHRRSNICIKRLQQTTCIKRTQYELKLFHDINERLEGKTNKCNRRVRVPQSWCALSFLWQYLRDDCAFFTRCKNMMCTSSESLPYVLLNEVFHDGVVAYVFIIRLKLQRQKELFLLTLLGTSSVFRQRQHPEKNHFPCSEKTF